MRSFYHDGPMMRQVIVDINPKHLKEFRKMFDQVQVTHNEVKDQVAKQVKQPKEQKATKLSQAVEIVKRTGKDDKPACMAAIQEALGVTKGNASIYYAKALVQLG
jgi:inosine/xanthosine triphosphate pyrophosphatase family protein